MRVSTSQIFDQGLTAMLNKQTEVSQAQLQVSTGKKILNPSDDPAASVQMLNLQREFSLTEQYLDNATKAENKQVIEEGALISATDILQRIREIAVQALSDTNGPDERKALAKEVSQLNEQLLSLSNSKDSSGDYLFSGFQTNTPPYETINGAYQGDEGQRSMKIGAGVTIETNDPGNTVFEARHIATTSTKVAGSADSNITISSGNGTELSSAITFTFNAAIAPSGGYDVNGGPTTIPYTAAESGLNIDLNALDSSLPKVSVTLTGTTSAADSFSIETSSSVQTMFNTIDQFVKALEADQVGANNGPNNGDFLINIDASMDRVLNSQAKIGARVNSIDYQRDINDGLSFNNQKILSEIRDLDYAEAVSRLSLQMTALEAAQKTFTRVQGLSLLNYL
jgi:flagellar hook-associated protein 3 FlgL